jgi:long-chain fatty acid transport protein
MKALFGNYKGLAVAGLSVGVFASQGLADQQHYNNVITGERAQGMGGAYAGVSDDASGVVYNPAGLAFAQSNDISGSANAFYNKKTKYKSALPGGGDWTEESGGTFAPFFGALNKLDSVLPGLVGGFAYYSIDTELKDQNNTISNSGEIARYHRAANQRAATWAMTGALGYRISSSLGIGFSLGYLKVDELTQISQNYYNTAGTYYLMTSVRESLIAHGIQTAIGLQWAPLTKLSLGLSVRSGTYASQKYSLILDKIIVKDNSMASTPSEVSSKKPLGSMPMEIRGGLAWFASPRLLVTSDVTYHEAVSDTDSLKVAFYAKKSVMNYALGSEYYLTPSLPLRLGYFTNKDATPNVSSSGKNQPDHVDYQGYSMFLAWAQPNSQISAGAVVQKGTGKAQKIADSTMTQNISSLAYTLGFSATHSF